MIGLNAADGDRFPHEFSGGQRQRIAIARSISTRAQFIACDEPTSALDVSVQAQILNLMRSLQERFELTYLFISHNLAVVRHMANRIGVMYLGRLVEVIDARDIFRAARHPYTRMLVQSVPDILDEAARRGAVAGKTHGHFRCDIRTRMCLCATLSDGGADMPREDARTDKRRSVSFRGQGLRWSDLGLAARQSVGSGVLSRRHSLYGLLRFRRPIVGARR